MNWKEKVVTAAVFVSSLFGGGAGKAAAANSASSSAEANTEMQSRNTRSGSGRTFTFQTQPKKKNVVERWVGNTKDQVKREIEIRKDRVAESGANAVRQAAADLDRRLKTPNGMPG